MSSELPKDKSFVQLVAVLKQYFEPKPVIIVQCFHFHYQIQEPGESVADHIAELCWLAVPCKFEGYLDDGLQDRLVCNLRDKSVQRRLLTEPELTIAERPLSCHKAWRQPLETHRKREGLQWPSQWLLNLHVKVCFPGCHLPPLSEQRPPGPWMQV